MQLGLNMFHERHPDVGLLLNVTRHPYSFNGDSRRGSLAGHGTKEGNEPTWHDSLPVSYTHLTLPTKRIV